MTICWYCCWGWPQAVADVYREALAELDGDDHALQFGPGHIVWSDENFEDDHIRWCLSLYDPAAFAGIYPDTTFEAMYRDRCVAADLDIVRRSLERLLEVPESVRCCEPAAYRDDDEHPERYPPPAGLEMTKDH